MLACNNVSKVVNSTKWPYSTVTATRFNLNFFQGISCVLILSLSFGTLQARYYRTECTVNCGDCALTFRNWKVDDWLSENIPLCNVGYAAGTAVGSKNL
jgi:hypothetical protein